MTPEQKRNYDDLNSRLQALQAVIGSVGWNEIILPIIAEKYADTLQVLLRMDRPKEGDDYLRGQINSLTWVMQTFTKRIKELNAELTSLQSGRRPDRDGLPPPI